MFYAISAFRAQQIYNFFQNYADSADKTMLIGMASAEHIAHTVAYEIEKHKCEVEIVNIYDLEGKTMESSFIACIPKTQAVKVFDDDGQIRQYHIKPISTAHKGIVAYLLLGVDLDNQNIHLVFRGTKDRYSLQRDFETLSPGHQSFQNDAEAIIQKLINSISAYPKNVDKIKLFISGHSLGGSDAQNCATNIFRILAEDLENRSELTVHNLRRISSITINHVNSAGVSLLAQAECKLYSEILVKKYSIKLQLRALRVGGDIVQKVGQTSILCDVDPDYVRVELLKIKSGHEGWLSLKNVSAALAAAYLVPYAAPVIFTAGMYIVANSAKKAHTERHFDKDKLLEYELYNNETSLGADIMRKKLQNQFNIDSYSLFKIVKDRIHGYLAVKNISINIDESWVHVHEEDVIEETEQAELTEQQLSLTP